MKNTTTANKTITNTHGHPNKKTNKSKDTEKHNICIKTCVKQMLENKNGNTEKRKLMRPRKQNETNTNANERTEKQNKQRTK